MSNRQILSQLSQLKRRYTTCSRRWATECPTSARRAYAAHLGVRQTKPPVTQTSFRPKTTFSLNFLIEQFRSKQCYRIFRVHVLLFRMLALRQQEATACWPKKNWAKILSTLLLIRTKLGMSWCIFISHPNIYQPPFCLLSSRHACTPRPFRCLQGSYSFRKEFNGNKRIPYWNGIV